MIVRLNRQHPAYDAAMEILVSLPRHPRFATLSDIRIDMRFTSSSRVRQAIQALRARGYKIETGKVFNGMRGRPIEAAWLVGRHADRAEYDSFEYVRRVHDGGQHV